MQHFKFTIWEPPFFCNFRKMIKFSFFWRFIAHKTCYFNVLIIRAFQIIESDDHIEIRWNFKAKNESRTFTLKYLIYDLIERYNDAATIYHKFVGNDWRKSQENVTITLLPPVNISQYDLQAWLHGQCDRAGMHACMQARCFTMWLYRSSALHSSS